MCKVPVDKVLFAIPTQLGQPILVNTGVDSQYLELLLTYTYSDSVQIDVYTSKEDKPITSEPIWRVVLDPNRGCVYYDGAFPLEVGSKLFVVASIDGAFIHIHPMREEVKN